MSRPVSFHPAVLRQDLAGLPPRARECLCRALRARIALGPRNSGRPLGPSLFGYWKLRVGEHRILCRVDRAGVTVLAAKPGVPRDGPAFAALASRLKSYL